jgi:hypothetical protein
MAKKPQTRHRRIKKVVVSDPTLSVAEFCDAECISKFIYYRMKKEGTGPREFRVGHSVRIAHEDRIAWRNKMRRAAA